MVIVFEGLHGCGKTTQIKLLKEWLEVEAGLSVNVSMWNSHELIKHITDIIKVDYFSCTQAITISHALDFYLRLEDLKKHNADVIIFDRYFYTQMVRDSLRGLSLEYISNIYSFSLIPDLIIYLDIDPRTAIKRVKKTNTIRSSYILGKDIYNFKDEYECAYHYFEKQREIYNNLLKNMKGYLHIDAHLNILKQNKIITGWITNYRSHLKIPY